MKTVNKFRTIDSVGNVIQTHSKMLSAAQDWNGCPSGVGVQELVFGIWEEVPTCELVQKLKEDRLAFGKRGF